MVTLGGVIEVDNVLWRVLAIGIGLDMFIKQIIGLLVIIIIHVSA